MLAESEIVTSALSAEELAKRQGLMARKPYIAAKLAKIAEMEERGQVSPIIRLEKSYLCNFQCTHCSAEYYMDRHLEKVVKIVDHREKMDLEAIRLLSKEADELGLARFVITGGEPLVMRDFDDVVAAIDPEKHYIITDTNGWFLDAKKARHLKSIGVEKVQLSLDSYIEKEHDEFRSKRGSYKRVLRALDACIDEGLNLLVSTVLIKGRARTKEFEDLCRYCSDRGVGLYVSYAKPTGSCTDHPEFVIDKEDADIVREFEKKYKVFTHMTPTYGSFKGCITVKGIITVTSTMEITPCPYIDFSIGNVRETPLKDILERGMKNPWLGPYRPDCLIGEDPKFIKLHTEKTHGAKLLPLRWGEGFTDDDVLDEGVAEPQVQGYFDQFGRCSAKDLSAPVHQKPRHYFDLCQPALEYNAIYQRIASHVPSESYPSAVEFKSRAEAILQRLKNDPQTENILNGIKIPFMLPKMEVVDEGEVLETPFLKALSSAYKEKFPQYEFVDHHKQALGGTLQVVEPSRHGALLEAMKKDAVVGYFFPCLREFSVPACIERMNSLPAEFLLAGGLDTIAALIGSPDLLFNSKLYAPLLWLAGLHSKEGEGYYFEAYGYNLTFNRRMHFDQASEYANTGLVVLG